MKQSPKRHGFPQWLLSRVVPQRFREEFFGDLEELYEDRLNSRSTSYARLMYWVDALHLILGFASRHKVKSQNSTIMLFSHLKIAFRSFSRNKAYTFINLKILILHLQLKKDHRTIIKIRLVGRANFRMDRILFPVQNDFLAK